MRGLVLLLFLSAGCLQAEDPNADGDGDVDTDSDCDTDSNTMSECNGRRGKELGDRFDGFEFPDCDGEAYSYERTLGNVLLFNVSTGWCGPCRKETPQFQTFYEEHSEEGLSIVQVLLETNAGSAASAAFCVDWRDEYGLTYPVLFDPLGVSRTYFDNPSAQMPLNVVVSREGCVVHRSVGGAGEPLFETLTAEL